MAGMIRRINAPLPGFAPKVRSRGLQDLIARLNPGEQGLVDVSHSSAKATCKRIVLAWCEHATGTPYIFAVWPAASDGSASETGKSFAIVARLTEAQAETFESQRPGCTVQARNLFDDDGRPMDERAA